MQHPLSSAKDSEWDQDPLNTDLMTPKGLNPILPQVISSSIHLATYYHVLTLLSFQRCYISNIIKMPGHILNGLCQGRKQHMILGKLLFSYNTISSHGLSLN